MDVYKIEIKNKDNLTIDFAVPGDMPLWALRYLLAKHFGFKTSEPYSFALEEDKFLSLAGRAVKDYKKELGIWYMSPYRAYDENDWCEEFDDNGDYNQWLEDKLTGPYKYNGHFQTKEDWDADFNDFQTDYADRVIVSRERNDNGYYSVRPIMDFEEYDEDTYDSFDFDDLPIEFLPYLFDNNIDDLVETLTIEGIFTSFNKIICRDGYNRDIYFIEIFNGEDLTNIPVAKVQNSHTPTRL